MDIDLFVASLDKIREIDPETLVMWHGPLLGSRKRIGELLDINKSAAERAVRLVLSALPGDITAWL